MFVQKWGPVGPPKSSGFSWANFQNSTGSTGRQDLSYKTICSLVKRVPEQVKVDLMEQKWFRNRGETSQRCVFQKIKWVWINTY